MNQNIKTIASNDLIPNQIPRMPASWKKIGAFAMTFNPMEESNNGQQAASLDNVSESWSVSKLRYHLYVEQRRWNHFGRGPDPQTMKKIYYTLDLLRGKVSSSGN